MPTKIEWTDETWNPVTGCTKISPGCANCYAETMCRRFWQQWDREPPPDHFGVKLHYDRLDQPLHWEKPRQVFVCSMGDLFHKDVPGLFLGQVFTTMQKASRHTFQILTKRAELMMLWLRSYKDLAYNWPNVWFGVTAEDQHQWNERTNFLCKINAAVLFVSVEPLLEAIDMKFGPNPTCIWCDGKGEWYADGDSENLPVTCQCMTRNRLLDWVIIGCESGPNRRPMELEWAIDLVHQCRAAGVACFVKQLPVNGKVSKDPGEWPKELRVREYPKGGGADTA